MTLHRDSPRLPWFSLHIFTPKNRKSILNARANPATVSLQNPTGNHEWPPWVAKHAPTCSSHKFRGHVMVSFVYNWKFRIFKIPSIEPIHLDTLLSLLHYGVFLGFVGKRFVTQNGTTDKYKTCDVTPWHWHSLISPKICFGSAEQENARVCLRMCWNHACMEVGYQVGLQIVGSIRGYVCGSIRSFNVHHMR